jgi:hypothetical protein
MCKTLKSFIALIAVAGLLPAVAANAKKGNKQARLKKEITRSEPAVLWRDPGNIASRDLYYGPGGKTDEPHTVFTFVKEDLKGTNPKFVVRDESGVEWKVKLGDEARPETAASRLVWAVGYFTNEDYFLPVIHVQRMPRLHRGQNLIASDGSIHNVRLKRYLDNEKKLGKWSWRHNRFSGTRELDGLRVMMALINNWDLSDENNSVYEEKQGTESRKIELHYMVSDLGASFGTAGATWGHHSKGVLKNYRKSKFVGKVTADYVDFGVPSRPALPYSLNPHMLLMYLHERWIGRRVPRSDARWIGRLLGELSSRQIRDAFRSAGYSPAEVDEFARLVEARIAELREL